MLVRTAKLNTLNPGDLFYFGFCTLEVIEEERRRGFLGAAKVTSVSDYELTYTGNVQHSTKLLSVNRADLLQCVFVVNTPPSSTLKCNTRLKTQVLF